MNPFLSVSIILKAEIAIYLTFKSSFNISFNSAVIFVK